MVHHARFTDTRVAREPEASLLRHAQAALRDYQHYQGRAAADEAKVERLLDRLAQGLQALPG